MSQKPRSSTPYINHHTSRLQFSLLLLILLMCHCGLFLALSVFQFVTVPAYFKAFEERQIGLTVATIFVDDVSRFFQRYTPLILPLLLAVDGAGLYLFNSTQGRIVWTCIAAAGMVAYLALSYLALQLPLWLGEVVTQV